MILLKNQHSDHWGTWKEPLKHMVGLLDPNPVVLHEKTKRRKKSSCTVWAIMHPVKSVRALRFLGMLSLEDDTILDLSIQLKKKQSLWSWARTVESGTSRAVLWMCCFQVGSQRLKHGRLRQPWFSFPLPFWKRKKCVGGAHPQYCPCTHLIHRVSKNQSNPEISAGLESWNAKNWDTRVDDRPVQH